MLEATLPLLRSDCLAHEEGMQKLTMVCMQNIHSCRYPCPAGPCDLVGPTDTRRTLYVRACVCVCVLLIGCTVWCMGLCGRAFKRSGSMPCGLHVGAV